MKLSIATDGYKLIYICLPFCISVIKLTKITIDTQKLYTKEELEKLTGEKLEMPKGLKPLKVKKVDKHLYEAVDTSNKMDHIHNETVLSFIKIHKDNINMQRFLKKEDEAIRAMNKELDTDYEDYLDYLEANIGDDASFTLEELQDLLKPKFEVKLNKKEQKEFDYNDFEIGINDLEKPVYIKDEGDFFSIFAKERMDIPVRLLGKFIKFLEDNNIKYENEYEN